MSRVVYTPEPRIASVHLLSPFWIIRNLLRHRELIIAYARREFHAAHRATYLGLAWSVISPLIMLALFVAVFGYVFGGKFSQRPEETPAEFALALFVGLSLFNCIAQSMASASSLVLANSVYVKSLSFPLEILSVSATLNVLINLAISFGICVVAHLGMYGFLHWTILFVPLYVVCVALISVGISWFLSSLAVFVRDVPSIVPPISTVLMFVSGCFFPLSVISPKVRWILELNPLAVILAQARGCFLYGQVPEFASFAIVFALSVLIALGGHWFFMKAKSAFADVI